VTESELKKTWWWRKGGLGWEYDPVTHTVRGVRGHEAKWNAAWWHAAFRYELAMRYDGNFRFPSFPTLSPSDQRIYIDLIFALPQNLPALRLSADPLIEFVDFENLSAWSDSVQIRLDAPDDRIADELKRFKKQQRIAKSVRKNEAKRRRDPWRHVELLDSQNRKGEPLDCNDRSKKTAAQRTAKCYHDRVKHYFSLAQ
jgi:hypothetical protein